MQPGHENMLWAHVGLGICHSALVLSCRPAACGTVGTWGDTVLVWTLAPPQTEPQEASLGPTTPGRFLACDLTRGN